jgi:hypothetical protein
MVKAPRLFGRPLWSQSLKTIHLLFNKHSIRFFKIIRSRPTRGHEAFTLLPSCGVPQVPGCCSSRLHASAVAPPPPRPRAGPCLSPRGHQCRVQSARVYLHRRHVQRLFCPTTTTLQCPARPPASFRAARAAPSAGRGDPSSRSLGGVVSPTLRCKKPPRREPLRPGRAAAASGDERR